MTIRELPKSYNPSDYENQIYQKWEKSGYFNPDNLSGEPYSILMPPPNVTGVLHLGHALENSLMDIMARYQRMKGKKVLLLPGTDHAAVATQAKVEKLLIDQGMKNPRQELGREKLLKEIKDFSENSKATILTQIKKMGTSCDWSRLAYTFDEKRSRAVNEVFIKMYNDGLIYRGKRIVNWDAKLQTVISDDEIVWQEEKATFYYLRYGPFIIATARPETKFGDKYVVMHPDDKRYKKYKHGEKFECEWINGKITATVIKDGIIDPKFGTGVMTITPWHDMVDFEIAERHQLKAEQIIDFNGKLMPVAGEFASLDILEARPKIIEKLKRKGLVVKTDENYVHRVARGDRSNGLVEPQIKEQWFVAVNKKITGRNKSLKNLMKEAVTVGHKRDSQQKIKITPERYNKIYINWIDNLRDWCISRQIWWGHQIPVWYKEQESLPAQAGKKIKKQESNISITYFVHGTTTDNEKELASGHNNVGLSALGAQQSKKLAQITKNQKFDIIFCSDLKRAADSAALVFGKRGIKIIKDKRLREIDYGKLTNEKISQVYPLKTACIDRPFPGGESYKDIEDRIRNFLNEIADKYPGKKIAIMSHQAPQLAMEVLLNDKTWQRAFEEDWRNNGAWLPGWKYDLNGKISKLWQLKIYGKDIFDAIASGTKTIETRAGRPRGEGKYWGDFKPGDEIQFSLADEKTDKIIKSAAPVKKMVKKVVHFKTIDQMFKIYNPEEDYPGKSAKEIKKWWQNHPKMNDRIKKYGIWAIELDQASQGKVLTKLILVRHGQTDWNKNEIMQGQKDIPLNHKGERDAMKLAKKIKDEKFDLIITSPLKRTSKTAELLNNLGVKIIEDDRLKERGYGKFEGKKTAEVLKEHPEITTFEVNSLPYWIEVPTAETYEQVKVRVKSFLADIKKEYAGKRVLIVSHGDTLDMFYAVLNNFSNEQAYGRFSLNMRLEKYELMEEDIYVGIESPEEKTNFVLLHGFYRTREVKDPLNWLNQKFANKNNFWSILPHPDKPNLEEQIKYVYEKAKITDDTVIVGHSLGGILALKLIEEKNLRIKKLVLIASSFKTHGQELKDYNKGNKFNFEKIKNNVREIIIFQAGKDHVIPPEETIKLAKSLNAKIIKVKNSASHFNSEESQEILDELKKDVWVQDEDTLDTWFSSGLWTFSTLGWPEKTDDLKMFHPTSWMQMGYEILFFWMARMILMSTYALDQIPFKDVYIHGILRNELGKKFSKSAGNSVDPLEVIKEYGTDALRLSLISGIAPGNDSRFYEEKVEGARNLVNKLWNVARYIITNYELGITDYKFNFEDLTLFDKWILFEMRYLILEIADDLDNYRFSQAEERLRKFTWDNLADWYLEVCKFEKNSSKDQILSVILNDLLRLWHPFIPFVTEAIWKEMGNKTLLLVERYPQLDIYKEVVKKFNKGSYLMETMTIQKIIVEIIVAIRNARSENKIEPNRKIKAVIYTKIEEYRKLIEEQKALIIGLRTGISELEVKEKGEKLPDAIYAAAAVGDIKIYLLGAVDSEKEKARLEKKINNLEKIIKVAESKLANKEFIKKAPAEIVKKENDKLKLYQKELKKIIAQLKSLK